MPEAVHIALNGSEMIVTKGTTVAAAFLQTGIACRMSVTGEPRTALCGMGICYECRATVDGVVHTRTCQLLCVAGMRVETTR